MKPISNGLKIYAQQSPIFSSACMRLANGYYKSYNSFARTLRLPYQATPLSPEKALKLGTELLGEGLVFGAASGVVYYEYHRSSKISKTSGDCGELKLKVDQMCKELDPLKKKVDQTCQELDPLKQKVDRVCQELNEEQTNIQINRAKIEDLEDIRQQQSS